MSDLSVISAQPWDVEHLGKVFQVNYLSLEIINKFTHWLKLATLKELATWKEIDAEEHAKMMADFRQAVIDRRYQWGATAVTAAMETPDGVQELLKYCVRVKEGTGTRDLTADELRQLQEGDPVNLAVQQVFEESLGPKAMWKQPK